MSEATTDTREGYERDYIERTIATVRNHRSADNCWPQWANIFADVIEAQWADRDRAESESVAHQGHVESLQAELALVVAERDRFRKALKRIAAEDCVLKGSVRSKHHPGQFCPSHAARAALVEDSGRG